MRKTPATERSYDRLLDRVREALAGGGDRAQVLQAVCDLLRMSVSHYDWVGFYLVDPARPRELVLGPYSGSPTEHVRIPFGRGICGQAAERQETFIVQDVREETNYLSCSAEVKSEIVVPIIVEGNGTRTIIGELDIDSRTARPFTEKDRTFLEGVCALAAALF